MKKQAIIVVSEPKYEELPLELSGKLNQVLELISAYEKILLTKKITLSDKYIRRVEFFSIPFSMFFKNNTFYYRPEVGFSQTYFLLKKRKPDSVFEGFIRHVLRKSGTFHLIPLASFDNVNVRILIKH